MTLPPTHEEFSVSDDFRLENYNLAHGAIHNWLGTSPVIIENLQL